jgi:hypothetical protein
MKPGWLFDVVVMVLPSMHRSRLRPLAENRPAAAPNAHRHRPKTAAHLAGRSDFKSDFKFNRILCARFNSPPLKRVKG